MQGAAAEGVEGKGVRPSDRGLTGLVDAILFLAVLGFSAIAFLALALAAPLAIAVSALFGALSALSAHDRNRGGWRVAGAA
ncbi:MAG: hypothetical protein ACOZAA_11525 [Pseudomonadota bacterium]